MCTGQGTMGLEVLDQVPDLDAIVIPVGGGGLIAGSYHEVNFDYMHSVGIWKKLVRS